MAVMQRRSAATARPCARSAVSQRMVVRCSAHNDRSSAQREPSRRDALLLGTVSLAAPLMFVNAPPANADVKLPYKLLPVNQLGSAQKADQRKEFVDRAQATIMKYLSPSDSATCVRLALLDAGTYDIATKTGGVSGAVAVSPPADVAKVVEKLRKAKADIDAEDTKNAGPISWADLIYLAGRATTLASWKESKIAKSGAQAVAQSGNPWPVEIGRVDSDIVGPNKVPAADASVEEITAFLKALGAKPGSGGPFSSKPPFWERPGFLVWTASAADQEAEEARFAAYSQTYADIKRSYDISRETISRTDYEVDFAAVYNKLASQGAVFDKKAYLYPQPILAPKL